MKKVALLTILSLSTALLAQESIKYEIEPTIGYNSFDSGSKMESTFLYGIRGTINPNSYYGYRLSYERSDNVHYENSSYIKTTDLQRVAGQIVVNGEEEYHVTPYLLLGIGYEILSDETKNDVSQAYIEGGIGFKYHFVNNMIFDLEAKALKKFDTDDVDYMMNVGFGYLFDPNSKSQIEESRSIFTKKKIKQPIKSKIAYNRYKNSSPSIRSSKKMTIKPIAKSKAVQKVDALYTFNEDRPKKITKKRYKDIVKENIATEKASNIYIQMAAWSKNVDDKLLSRLEKSGYNFELLNAKRATRDVQLVLVGPFDNSKKAKNSLKKLKKIKKDAFITKI